MYCKKTKILLYNFWQILAILRLIVVDKTLELHLPWGGG
jgi:hypothetical protein